MAKAKCIYCKGPITENSPSHYNCGCRTKPSPVAVPAGMVLAHDTYKSAVEVASANLDVNIDNLSIDEAKALLRKMQSDISEAIVKATNERKQY
ncbi:hypothetical protein ABD91_21330 [Lysinibacillus sphaericus]|uniref:hypothetical protein n=1 Tax=Lysinibacillus sphaericus TaxID=1421 RepID=UPI0018CE0D09|nr:hypothetical protein [Lysinibacillus sphaericus]MBG9693281.1 hypothetical protein [Lysinibacillus sphaericus]